MKGPARENSEDLSQSEAEDLEEDEQSNLFYH
jgi:hypothetical protein